MKNLLGCAVLGWICLACSSAPVETNGAEYADSGASTPNATTPTPGAASRANAAATEDAQELPAPILTIDIAPGHTVSFHEVGDTVLIAERAQNGMPSVLKDIPIGPASVMYEALRPGEQAPAVLTAAMERARALRALSDNATDEGPDDLVEGGGFPASAQSTRQDGVAQLSQPITAAYFTGVLNGCYVSPNASESICRVGWANGLYAYRKAQMAAWKVASQYGAPTVKLSFGNNRTFIETLPHNGYASYVVTGELCCPILCFCAYHPRTLRLDIIDSPGVIFHVGGYWIV